MFRAMRCFLPILLAAWTASAKVDVREDKLVGTWISPQCFTVEDGQSQEQAEEAAMRELGNTLFMTYRADHTWSAGKLGEPPTIGGWWRIEGTELISGVKVGTPREVERVHILSLDDRRLTTTTSIGVENHWWRLPNTSNQAMQPTASPRTASLLHD
jgi:hypothetical protein